MHLVKKYIFHLVGHMDLTDEILPFLFQQVAWFGLSGSYQPVASNFS